MSLTPEQYRDLLQLPVWSLQVIIPGKDILFESAPFSDEALRDVCEHMVSASVRECVIIVQGIASEPAPVRSRTSAVEYLSLLLKCLPCYKPAAQQSTKRARTTSDPAAAPAAIWKGYYAGGWTFYNMQGGCMVVKENRKDVRYLPDESKTKTHEVREASYLLPSSISH